MNGIIDKMQDPSVMKDAVDGQIISVILGLMLGVGTLTMLFVASAIYARQISANQIQIPTEIA